MKIIKTESIPLCHFDVSYERIVRLPADLRRILNFKVRATMYALIYDEFDPSKREKKVISVHKSRETAEKTLKKRQRTLGKKVWECNTRIVWVHQPVQAGDTITPSAFETWAPGEAIPAGDRVPDGD